MQHPHQLRGCTGRVAHGIPHQLMGYSLGALDELMGDPLGALDELMGCTMGHPFVHPL